jgi:hypothetical protein
MEAQTWQASGQRLSLVKDAANTLTSRLTLRITSREVKIIGACKSQGWHPGSCDFSLFGKAYNVKDTPSQKAGQAGPVENTRPLPYTQIINRLLTLPIGEFDAAIRVWSALHGWLRLGSDPKRVTDEDLLSCPYLLGTSAEHARKGLELLERERVIVRRSRGSRREIMIAVRLAGHKEPRKQEVSGAHLSNRSEIIRKPIQAENDVIIPQNEWAARLRLLVSGD